MPSAKAEGDRHNCCCEHVVESLEAMRAPDEERRGLARSKFYNCPHHDITPLESWLGIKR